MRNIYKIMFWISSAVTLFCLALFIILGLNLGVDFVGGSVLELNFSRKPDIEKVKTVMKNEFPDIEMSVNETGEKGALIRTIQLTEGEHQRLLSVVNNNFAELNPQETRFDSIGPVIGDELKRKSITGMILVLIGIIVYIAVVFRKLSNILSSWAMGFAAIAAMLHTIIVPLGVFSYLGRFENVQLGAIFVAALLTILGYSVSDTVVVFDRIRENVLKFGRKESFGELVHKSIMQTLTRSISTGFATILSLIAVAFFGGETLRYFSIALIMGIVLGSYSSIFIASPILHFWSKKKF